MLHDNWLIPQNYLAITKWNMWHKNCIALSKYYFCIRF